MSRLQSSYILVFQLLEFKRTPKPCLCSLLDQNLCVRGVCPTSCSLNVFSHTVLEVSAVSPSPFTVSPSCSLWSYATEISEAVCLSALCFCLSLWGGSRLWLGAADVLVPRAMAGGGFTLQAKPLPPKHNQLCLQDTGTLLGLQPHKWLHTWSPLCLIKPFSSTPGKKNQVISDILLPPKLLCALESPMLALLSLTFPLCKMGVQLCQCVEVYK